MPRLIRLHEYRTVDKSTWGGGPWDAEPDKVQYRDESTGLACLAVRSSRLGCWCGYVGVPPEHPLHGVDFDNEAVRSVEVHGGLSFSGACSPSETPDRGICHVPEPGAPEVWWLGFDCGHAWDVSPLMAERYGVAPDQTYRTLAYVERELVGLASQLAEAIR